MQDNFVRLLMVDGYFNTNIVFLEVVKSSIFFDIDAYKRL